MNDLRYPIGRFRPPEIYSPEGRAAFIETIGGTPGGLRAAVAGLDTDRLLTPYRDGGWTAAQVVHHLADSHMNAYMRCRLALTESDPTIKPYSEGAWARLSDAASPEVAVSIDLLTALHDRWVRLLRSLDAADFDRTYLHPERGPMTIDRTLALYAWHGSHHIAHINGLRQRNGW